MKASGTSLKRPQPPKYSDHPKLKILHALPSQVTHLSCIESQVYKTMVQLYININEPESFNSSDLLEGSYSYPSTVWPMGHVSDSHSLHLASNSVILVFSTQKTNNILDMFMQHPFQKVLYVRDEKISSKMMI